MIAVCACCGYLRIELPTAGDPMRRALDEPRACPCCRRTAWLAPHELPIESRTTPLATELGAWRIVPVFFVVTAVVIGGLAPFGYYHGDGEFWVAVYPLLALMIASARVHRHPRWAASPRDATALPQRWRLPLGDDNPAQPLAGAMIPTHAPLRAAISGEPCVAYCIAVRRRDEDRWLLIEQRSAACRVGGTALPADAILVPTGRRLAIPEAATEYVRTWLRARGLPCELDALAIHETVIAPSAVARLVRTEHPWMRGSVYTFTAVS
ncbi:MAG TPA: hypothetical protein VFG69_00605 [Nannocystaceae bacterium]|nr:hypothetical protein [Nannocystaceae bacterium]